MKAKFLGAPLVAVSVLLASASAQDALSDQRAKSGFTIPRSWTRAGVVLERQKDAKGTSVSGDPCIVWDEAIKGWRMVLFHSPPGHAQAVCFGSHAYNVAQSSQGLPGTRLRLRRLKGE